MPKIPAVQAAKMFEEIIGWPYKTPGTNDARGIDCSGAWVRVYQRYGKSIYHGSNTQYRRYCQSKGRLLSTTPLHVGMGMFKRRFDGREPGRYRGDGLGNFYHVGCLTSINPLRIVHATMPSAKVDTNIGQWTHWGLLTEVDYTSAPDPIQPRPGQAIVNTRQSGLRLRKEPSLSGAPICEMPKGSILNVLDSVTEWTKVWYSAPSGMRHIGWCSTKYLLFG